MLTLNALVHAPAHLLLSLLSGPHHHRCSSTSTDHAGRSSPMAASARIAVVGDVHDDWDLEEDTKALQVLQPDLVLFTGRCLPPYSVLFVVFSLAFVCDFGNENVELVQSVASLKFPKAVILGNHDAWKSQHFSSKKKKNGVQLQLESLGEDHVAFKRLDFPALKLSVVGGRPFSCGGEHLFRKNLLSARYGVHNMDESANRIYNAAVGSPEEHLVIFLAHNGPKGLGSNLNDICGKDWVPGGGDHGDPDLEKAICLFKERTKIQTPLVVFGHMHKELAHGNGLRKMIVVGADKTIYLNAAIVPRVQRLNPKQGASNRSFVNEETSFVPESGGTTRAFTLVQVLDSRVHRITETWVSVVGDEATLQEEQILFDRDQSCFNR
ncbi:hypothetical protein Tsubulata_011980 [Turnera subulata]|uniref:Calcineurin-like phosphoesterase domain-containing protein n=1 Tax=Turnera subulata TaxID=218843 RepID=A0A9Q0J6Z2_9ROSI|nr:hypothetical protein Tsubulata_011980 [Turnera subulata]